MSSQVRWLHQQPGLVHFVDILLCCFAHSQHQQWRAAFWKDVEGEVAIVFNVLALASKEHKDEPDSYRVSVPSILQGKPHRR